MTEAEKELEALEQRDAMGWLSPDVPFELIRSLVNENAALREQLTQARAERDEAKLGYEVLWNEDDLHRTQLTQARGALERIARVPLDEDDYVPDGTMQNIASEALATINEGETG